MSRTHRKSTFADPTKQPQFYQNQDDQKARVFRPIELYLETEKADKGIKIARRKLEKDEQGYEMLGEPATRPVRSLQEVNGRINDQKDGLMSLFRKPEEDEPSNTFHVTPKMLACITCYSETKSQMEDSLNGLLQNLHYFQHKSGIGNHEIVVVVIFDGIDKLNDCMDNDKSMMTLFQQEDRLWSVQKKLTMRYQKDQFQLMQRYAAMNVNVMRKNGDLSIFKKDVDLNNEMAQYLQRQVAKEKAILQSDPHQREIYEKETELEREKRRDAIKFDFLDYVKKRGEKYIKDRNQTAWVYMTRRELEVAEADDLAAIKKLDNKKVSVKVQPESPETKADDLMDFLDSPAAGMGVKGLSAEEQKQAEEDQNYLYLFYCAKHKNGGKLSSHLWFFTGFCELFQPEYTVLLDCGLKPGDNSIYNFFLALETDPHIGGVCGFMGLQPENVYNDAGTRDDDYDKRYVDCLTHFMNSIFDIQKAQVFEYDFAHIVDKPFESLFGFIHVLPGAFSAYRWSALKKDKTGDNILQAYLKTVITKNFTYSSLEDANMYLAEDRILCLKIYTRLGQRFKLRYIPTAKAVVDPITTIPNLMGQRRRWINGTWYALQYVLSNTDLVYQSDHSAWEIFWFRVSMYYANMMRGFTYILIGMTMGTSFMIFKELFYELTLKANFGGGDSLISLMSVYVYLYITLLMILVFYALNFNHRNQNANSKFYFVATYLGLLTLVSFVILFYYAFVLMFSSEEEREKLLNKENSEQKTIINQDLIRYLVIGSFVMNALPVFFNMDKSIELLSVLLHYIYYSPTYIHGLLIFAFCRIDDLSWGTKGLEAESGKENLQQEFKWTKFVFVSKWIFINTLYVTIVSMFMNDRRFKEVLVYILGFLAAFILGIRCIGSLLYYFYFYGYFIWKMKSKQRQSFAENREKTKESRQRLQQFFESRLQITRESIFVVSKEKLQNSFDIAGSPYRKN